MDAAHRGSLMGSGGKRETPPHRPPVPACEERRLEELHALDILDTAFEERFDRYTTLLASLYRFPLCLVSLVDDDRQWLKSATDREALAREASRDLSFCAHAVAQGDMLLIPDTSADERFAEHPWVVGPPYIRFYAGALLRGPGGLPLGTICALDYEPRSFDARDCEHLRQFAELVERELVYNRDIERARAAARYTADYDPLTGLPNRRLLVDRLGKLLELRAEQGVEVAVYHVDVANFLAVNRGLGEKLGDQVLSELADRLRAVCPAAGTVARLHADRFAMVVPRSAEAGPDPDVLAYELSERLSRPLFVGEGEHRLGVRVGVALSGEDGSDTAETLLERAAAAARQGRGEVDSGATVHFHDRRAEAGLERHFALERRLRGADDRGELSLVFQPIYEVASGRIVSMEALVRWRDPELGEVTPGEFVPLAEATGLILPIGRWIMADALGRVRDWRAQGLTEAPLHVNLSARELEQDDLVERITELLDEAGLPGEALSLEVTETALLRDLEANAEKLRQLNARGVQFYIDDFGKGYSSLQYLRRLPLTALKIDRSFVEDITDQAGDGGAVVRAIVALGRTLGVTVVAEGVETDDQLRFLREQGCERVQGFLFGHPVGADGVPPLFGSEE